MSTEKNPSVLAVLLSRQGMPAVLAAATGVAMSIIIFIAAYAWERNSIREDFDSLADDRFHASESMFHETVKLVNFTDNVFLVGPPANSPAFPGYVRSLKQLLESDFAKGLKLHGLTWLPKVSRAERGDYERAAQAVFDPKYQIREPSDSDKKGADKQRADYSFPCYLSVGNTSLAARLGEDLSLDPEAWKAMQQARDSGEATATAPIKMSNDANANIGYRIFQALYVGVNAQDLKTVEDRRQACVGFVCFDLDIGDLIDSALKNVQPVGIEVLVYDGIGSNRTAVCRHSSRLQQLMADKNMKESSSELETSMPSEFFGRKVLLSCRSTNAFWAKRTVWQPWVFLFGGLVVTFVLAGYQLSLALRTSMIERVVSARLAAIQKSATR